MHDFDFSADRPALLVSVRDAEEARTALAGGAEVIDVKEEPSRGPLGAPDSETVDAVVAAVGERTPISVAAGELLQDADRAAGLAGVSFLKIGLAGCRSIPNWPEQWRAVFDRVSVATRPIAVAYADWEDADAPAPDDMLAAASAIGCPALLIDTWNKSTGTLFDHWPVQELAHFCGQVRAAKIGIALAGSLRQSSLPTAAACRPNLVAIRGAACDDGRLGRISKSRVQSLLSELRALYVAGGDRLLSPSANADSQAACEAAETVRNREFS